MPPEETSAPEVLQPAPELPSPAVEVSAETPPPEAVPSTPEPAPAPAEAVPAPETDQSPSQTGQIGGNDPLPPEAVSAPSYGGPTPDPIPSAQPTPEPPSAAAPAQTGILHAARDLLVKARVTMQDRKRKKRDKIMEALTKKNKITNDEVEKLLHVSDSTAERYLSVLAKEGKIIKVGKQGKGVLYIKTP